MWHCRFPYKPDLRLLPAGPGPRPPHRGGVRQATLTHIITCLDLCNLQLFGVIFLTAPNRKWAVTGIGLGVIPFIVHPIDTGVHIVMDNTTRKLIGGAPSKPEE